MQIEQSKARILADCIEGMAADADDKGKDSFGIHLSLQDARMIARSLSRDSTVDAVPVVRCRECVSYGVDAFGNNCCNYTEGLLIPQDDAFCSYGQRRDQSAEVRKKDGGEDNV